MEVELRLELDLEPILLGFDQAAERLAKLPSRLAGAWEQHQSKVKPTEQVRLPEWMHQKNMLCLLCMWRRCVPMMT